jgi:branched-chain amino acid transport system ATP-binding protein
MHQPDRGEIRLAGRDITALAPFRRVRAGVALKFQTTRIYRQLSVDENLRIAHAGEAHGLAGELVDEFGLTPALRMPALELTHAQQQWLEICMALATGARLLLLDEPTAGMTEEETGATAVILRRLRDRGMTIVVVEHDMAFVRDVAEHVTVLHNGAVFASGTIEQIEADPAVREIYLGEREDG